MKNKIYTILGVVFECLFFCIFVVYFFDIKIAIGLHVFLFELYAGYLIIMVNDIQNDISYFRRKRDATIMFYISPTEAKK